MHRVGWIIDLPWAAFQTFANPLIAAQGSIGPASASECEELTRGKWTCCRELCARGRLCLVVPLLDSYSFLFQPLFVKRNYVCQGHGCDIGILRFPHLLRLAACVLFNFDRRLVPFGRMTSASLTSWSLRLHLNECKLHLPRLA